MESHNLNIFIFLENLIITHHRNERVLLAHIIYLFHNVWAEYVDDDDADNDHSIT